MADIELKCPVCSRNVTVSEFVDPEAIFCRSCGQKLQMSATRPSSKTKPALSLRTAPPVEYHTNVAVPGTGAAPAAEQPPQEWRFHTQTKSRTQPEKKVHAGPAMISWLIFSFLAFIMYFLRYRGILPREYFIYLPYVTIAFHILIMLKAFRDSIFHGIICFLFPPYSLYYLFLVSDDFYLRGVFGGILVAVGEESFYFFRTVILHCIRVINEFIQGGAFNP